MLRLRAFLSLLVGLVAFTLVSCGGPSSVAPPPTYSDAQLQQIARYMPEVNAAYDHIEELQAAIEAGNWQEIRSTIRGPFGSMIQDLNLITRNLLPADQKAARDTARSVFQDFVAIDQAATNKDTEGAMRSFNGAVRDLDRFISNLPELPEIVKEAASDIEDVVPDVEDVVSDDA